MNIKIGLVDDHQLFLKSLGSLLSNLNGFEVVVDALNGQELQHKLKEQQQVPDLMLIDVNMPVMDGPETAIWMQKHYPSVKLIALSMNDKESWIIKMFRAGCCAYLLKDVHPSILEKALTEVYTKGYFNADMLQTNPARLLHSTEVQMSAKEQDFLKLACSEMTYNEIAKKMGMAERTIDGYREALFHKFGVKTRVGLCLEAVRRGFIEL